MYLRFVQMNVVEGMKVRSGIFSAAYALREARNVDLHTHTQLEELLAWFRQNLAIPSRFTRSSSKGAHRRSVTYGLSWYKPSARQHLDKSYELSSLLRQSGYFIEVLKTTRLGYVLYEDEYQIVAEPFADSRR